MNIALIDSQQIFTTTLRQLLLSTDFVDNVSAFKSLKLFSESFNQDKTDLVISELLLEDGTSTDILDFFKTQKLNYKVLILSAISDAYTIRQAMYSGVSGYLGKNSSFTELVDAIRSAINGDVFLSGAFHDKLIHSSIVKEQFLYKLSMRERQLLDLVCAGHTLKESASAMGLSSNTVQSYYKKILKKFNLKKTSDLIIFSMENGLHSHPPKF